MKALIKTIAVVMAVVFIVTSAPSVFAEVLPENQEENKISAEESSVWSDDTNDADNQAETTIADDTDSEDQEEIEIPAEEEEWDEETSEADDQTESDIDEDDDFKKEESPDDDSYDDDSYYEEESESQEIYEPSDDDLLGNAIIVMPWTSLQNRINDASDGDTIVLDRDYTATNGEKMLVVEGK
ncbi:MAG: hypothetical protein ACSW8A_11195, partial [Lachnospiraceae bacterium]